MCKMAKIFRNYFRKRGGHFSPKWRKWPLFGLNFRARENFYTKGAKKFEKFRKIFKNFRRKNAWRTTAFSCARKRKNLNLKFDIFGHVKAKKFRKFRDFRSKMILCARKMRAQRPKIGLLKGQFLAYNWRKFSPWKAKIFAGKNFGILKKITLKYFKKFFFFFF